MIAASAGISSDANRAAPRAAHLSIVVLPFANLSGDPTQDYFADGVTENLTTELSRIKGSFVIARNTAFTYKGKSIDAKEIGKELGVRYVLEGSVQRDGAGCASTRSSSTPNRARICGPTASRRTWPTCSSCKMRSWRDWPAVWAAALIYAEAEKGARSHNPDAIDLTMRGLDLMLRTMQQPQKEARDANGLARQLFERALAIDSDDADASAGNAWTYLLDYFFKWGDPGANYEVEVLGEANRAIGLDPNNVRAYFVKAQYLNMSGRPGEALGAAEAGLAVNPNYVLLYMPRAMADNFLADSRRRNRMLKERFA